jgi:hypothetical protein
MANAQIMRDVHALETSLDLCVMRVDPIGMVLIVNCSPGRASTAMAKADVSQTLRNVSVKSNLQVQDAHYAPQNSLAPIVPDTVIPSKLVTAKENVTKMDFAS